MRSVLASQTAVVPDWQYDGVYNIEFFKHLINILLFYRAKDYGKSLKFYLEFKQFSVSNHVA